MGKPAARLGDQTAHGGSIVAGCPTVLIGGKPAARLGDMHVCPMMTPGVPPIPHVGGPVNLGSAGVMIGGMPAARVGDMCVCTGPPDSIVVGEFTVLIGEVGGGGGGGGGAGGSASGTGADSSAGSGSGSEGSSDSSEEETEDHTLDIKFVDQGGKPITGVQYKVSDPDQQQSKGAVFGGLKRTGVQAGNHEVELKAVTLAAWSTRQACDGETVRLQIETAGVEDGTEAAFTVFARDVNQADKQVGDKLTATVQGGRAEIEWVYDYAEIDSNADDAPDRPEPFTAPQFYFKVNVDGFEARSPLLEYKDSLEIKLLDPEGNPMGGADYEVYLPSGEVKTGQLDANGYAKVEGVRPGQCRVRFPNSGQAGNEG